MVANEHKKIAIKYINQSVNGLFSFKKLNNLNKEQIFYLHEATNRLNLLRDVIIKRLPNIDESFERRQKNVVDVESMYLNCYLIIKAIEKLPGFSNFNKKPMLDVSKVRNEFLEHFPKGKILHGYPLTNGMGLLDFTSKTDIFYKRPLIKSDFTSKGIYHGLIEMLERISKIFYSK